MLAVAELAVAELAALAMLLLFVFTERACAAGGLYKKKIFLTKKRKRK
jgi:hypothetical protein